ncbi:MAG: hypothetical protein ACH350_09270 [Parachlamydiaceae bacterium]
MRKTLTLLLILGCMMQQKDLESTTHLDQAFQALELIKNEKNIEGIRQQINLLQYEIEAVKHHRSPDNIYRLNKWIGKLEGKVLNLKYDAKDRLEKYQNKLDEVDETCEKTEAYKEKIRSSDEMMKKCQEILNALEELKEELNPPSM